MSIGIFIAGVLFGVALTVWLRRAPPAPPRSIADEAQDASVHRAADAERDALPAPPETSGQEAASLAEASAQETSADTLYRLRRDIESDDSRIQSPEDLSRLPAFREGVALLKNRDIFPPKALLEQLQTDSYSMGCMLYTALLERDDIAAVDAVTATSEPGMYQLRFMLDYLQAQPDAAALPALLPHLRQWWYEQAPLRQRMREYLQWAEQHAPGDSANAAAEAMSLQHLRDYELEQLREGLQSFAMPVLAPFLAQAKAESARRREQRTLGGVGRLWAPKRDDRGDTADRAHGEAEAAASLAHADAVDRVVDRIVDHPELDLQVAKLYDMLHGASSVSVLVCGEHGTGKTVLVDRLFAKLHAEGWLLFEASAAEVLAGQSYIGELEERMREMLAALDRPRALWRVQDFYDLLHKGGHNQDPRGILDLLLPALERGQLRMVGELSSAQLAQLLIARPTLRHLTKTVTLLSPDAAAMRDLLERWRDAREQQLGAPVADARSLDEAQRMAAQYFPEQHEPGRSLRLLEEAL